MIKIITGKINSGKTSYAKLLAKELGLCGVVSEKVFCDGIFMGYDIINVHDNHRLVLARKLGIEQMLGPCIGRFQFSDEAFRIANQWLFGALKSSEPVVIDEIGPLELSGKGFAPVMTVVNKYDNLTVVIREQILGKCLEKWNFIPDEIITI